ncbi:uncharacterized protein LOC119193696, partial [Manduca sexta]|uniref:uncharacterized protein LOC119193696 n=1 Tax=Manduca sexta TaxID=7130 RepID=UPI0018907512
MPRLKYASVVRGVVILALFCLWLQIILSAGSGNGGTGYRDGGFEFTHDPIELKGLLIKKHTTVYKDTNSIKEQLVTLPPFTPVTGYISSEVSSTNFFGIQGCGIGVFYILGFNMTFIYDSCLGYSLEELMNANDTSEHVLALVPPELHKYLTVHPKNFS